MLSPTFWVKNTVQTITSSILVLSNFPAHKFTFLVEQLSTQKAHDTVHYLFCSHILADQSTQCTVHTLAIFLILRCLQEQQMLKTNESWAELFFGWIRSLSPNFLVGFNAQDQAQAPTFWITNQFIKTSNLWGDPTRFFGFKSLLQEPYNRKHIEFYF